MRNLDEERLHLAEADRHIAQGERNIAGVEALIERIRERGGNTEDAERSVEAMKEVLATFRDHREGIIRTIEAIEAGKL
jgi:hypothetical protein